ncbi:hypothetical protein pb186bvf_015338 [Paramecium bursaria]
MGPVCGKQQKIEVTNLRSHELQPLKFELNEFNMDAEFNYDRTKFKWSVIRRLTGEDLLREEERLKELERQRQDQLRQQKKEEDDIQNLQNKIDNLNSLIKEKRILMDQKSDLYMRAKKKYLIFQIKNELLKRMIKDDIELKKQYMEYNFNAM